MKGLKSFPSSISLLLLRSNSTRSPDLVEFKCSIWMFSSLKYIACQGRKRGKGKFMAFYKMQNGIQMQFLYSGLLLTKHGRYLVPFRIRKCCGSKVNVMISFLSDQKGAST